MFWNGVPKATNLLADYNIVSPWKGQSQTSEDMHRSTVYEKEFFFFWVAERNILSALYSTKR